MKRRPMSEETKRKIAESNRKNPKHKELGKRVGLSNVGRKLSEEHKLKIGEGLKGKQAGSKSWNWKGGITPLRKKLYFSLEYKLWRKSVFERDDYTCVWCGSIENLTTDHIKPWEDYPELRFAIDNGRTLCLDCHRKTDTWGRHKYKR